MSVQYSLYVLKDKRDKLREKLNEIDDGIYDGEYPKENIARLRTKIKHDIGDLDYSIEVLEEHRIDYE